MKQKEKGNKNTASHSYNAVGNIGYMLGKLWDWDKRTFYYMLLQIPVVVLISIIGVYLPKIVLSELERNASAFELISKILEVTSALIICVYLERRAAAVIHWSSGFYRHNFLRLLLAKTCDTDYENLENIDFKNLYHEYFMDNINQWGPMEKAISSFQLLCSNIIGFLFFSTLTVFLNPILTIVVIVTTLINSFFLKKNREFEKAMRTKLAKVDRECHYIIGRSSDFSMGKDIRLYRMKEWFLDIYRRSAKRATELRDLVLKNRLLCSSVDYGLVFIRDGAAYGYLIYMVLWKNMSVSDFVLYFGVIASLSGWFSKLLSNIQDLSLVSAAVSSIRKLLDFPDRSNRGPGLKLRYDIPCDIELRNVCYTYPGAGKPTIKNISLKIKKGEKLAIVGINGAGKTTLVKLICGFYTPTDGSVHVNGHGLEEYNRDEYYDLISVVFQDVQFLPLTIGENIAQGKYNANEKDRIYDCLRMAGIYEKVEKLGKGIDTNMGKGIVNDATDFSGGESQKLILARALYKNSPVLILDEPTAALDPIAEQQMYLKYSSLAKGKTTVFISHRLSSTRFCDRIVLMENGEIIESGTHDQLMEMGGKYSEMFEIQSHYYKDNACQVS